MEVKDILEDLSEEQKQLLETQERKEKYKKLQHFLNSKEFDKITKYFENKWKEIETQIIESIKTRKEAKVVKSELDKNYQFYNFQNELIEQLWESEWEKILKEDLKSNSENTFTHCLNKIEELYDAPVYSELDLLKQLRIDYIMVWERFRRMSAFYLDTKDIEDNANPYEEVK